MLEILYPSFNINSLLKGFDNQLSNKQHTNFIVFGLNRSGLEPTIYNTRGEHANHYTTDVVSLLLTFTW